MLVPKRCLQLIQQAAIERIDRSTGEAMSGCPDLSEVSHDLRRTLAVRDHISRSAQIVVNRHGLHGENPPQEADPAEPILAALRLVIVATRCIGVQTSLRPVGLTRQIAAQHAHTKAEAQPPPSRGWRCLKSSAISSIVCQLTPWWPLMYSMSLSSMRRTWGLPATSGWIVIGNTA